jgi:hypothetical protein
MENKETSETIMTDDMKTNKRSIINYNFTDLIYWYNTNYTMYHYYEQKKNLFNNAYDNEDELYPLLNKLRNYQNNGKTDIRIQLKIAKILK